MSYRPQDRFARRALASSASLLMMPDAYPGTYRGRQDSIGVLPWMVTRTSASA